jgi:LETM1 and EF-hand domain-containing protein 1
VSHPRDYDGKVTAEEVAAAAMFLKDSLDNSSVHELISKLAKDPDGKILVEDIVKLGTTAEGVEGDHDDISQPQQKQQQTAI